MNIDEFLKNLKAMKEAVGGKGYVTIEILHAWFGSAEWEDLGHHDSELVKFLNSNLFMDSDASLVNIERFKIFGLLNCKGSLDSKINCFTEIVKK